jgi:hypothetical protein
MFIMYQIYLKCTEFTYTQYNNQLFLFGSFLSIIHFIGSYALYGIEAV